MDSDGMLRVWQALEDGLQLLRPIRLGAQQWQVLRRLHEGFNDRGAHVQLPMPIAQFRAPAWRAILRYARQFDDVETADLPALAVPAGDVADAMAGFARSFSADVDRLMAVLVPPARYRKGHYAYGRFLVPAPHGLHTDHSAEDPAAEGEPICIARIATLGTHCVVGDEASFDAGTTAQLQALQYWTPVDGKAPEEVLDELLQRGVLRSMPVNQVVLMVAGNRSPRAQITRHIAARPPPGGIHSAFFQRQYRLEAGR